jgi:hypothetical protein
MNTLFSSFTSRGLMILAVTFLAGMPLGTMGLYQCYVTYTDLADGIHATGTVLRSVETDDGTKGTFYPRVRFTSPQGVMRFTDRAGASVPEFQDGASVPIFFPPYQPEKARIFSWKRVWFVPVLLSASGLLPLIAGIVIVWFFERKSVTDTNSEDEW